ncbi:hypothetical protein SpCBS45565_g08282 [Spizellomyces sp. 'palustris']|nr:hypothetical protein SpCBS45565_g08282 [Spizellomyces sp. 'palustris']
MLATDLKPNTLLPSIHQVIGTDQDHFAMTLHWTIPPDTKQQSEEEVRWWFIEHKMDTKQIIKVYTPFLTSTAQAPVTNLVRCAIWEVRKQVGMETKIVELSEEEARVMFFGTSVIKRKEFVDRWLTYVGVEDMDCGHQLGQVHLWICDEKKVDPG